MERMGKTEVGYGCLAVSGACALLAVGLEHKVMAVASGIFGTAGLGFVVAGQPDPAVWGTIPDRAQRALQGAIQNDPLPYLRGNRGTITIGYMGTTCMGARIYKNPDEKNAVKVDSFWQLPDGRIDAVKCNVPWVGISVEKLGNIEWSILDDNRLQVSFDFS